MSIRFSSTGLIINDTAPLHHPLNFIDCLMRGIGQVMLQNNSYAGILFLAGILYNSPLLALAALIGTGISTTTALLLGAERSLLRNGMFGFNGALVGIALLFFLQPDVLIWGVMIIAAALSTIAMAALLNLFKLWKMPALTAPFVLTTLSMLLASNRLSNLQSTQLPTATLPKSIALEGAVSFSTMTEGLFTGIAQVFFQGSIVTGLLFAAGLLISSRIAFIAALTGSLIGMLVAWGMGGDEPAIRSGLYGFNSVLTAIALVSVFFILDTVAIIYALLATIMTAVVYAAVSTTFEPLGMPALTLPFVLVVWLFIAASPLFPKLRKNE